MSSEIERIRKKWLRAYRNGAGKRLNKALFCAEWGSFPPFASPISTQKKKAHGAYQNEAGKRLNGALICAKWGSFSSFHKSRMSKK
jgi:hypothetical protein